MIRFWLFAPVIYLNIQFTLFKVTEGNQDSPLLGPPKNSTFDIYKNLCGIANYCETPGDVGCELGEKRRKRDTSQGEDYINLGKSVPKFKYPWMALLAVKEKLDSGWKIWEDNYEHIQYCTGSLISMRHVLTARHCMTGRLAGSITGLDPRRDWDLRKKPVVEDKLYVLLGADRVGEREDTSGPFTFEAEKKVFEVIIPPVTVHGTAFKAHDFALLRIEDVIFTEKIRPICLPLDGIPLGGHYIQAGFGKKGVIIHPDTGERKQTLPDALQEIDDVYLDPVTVNPDDEVYPHLGGENLPNHVVEPNDGTFAHDGTGVKPYFFLHSADRREGCDGDSGGPVMWRNPVTGTHFLVGVYSGSLGQRSCEPNNNQIIRKRVWKVTYWMEFIYKEMRPISYANEICLADECKKNSNTTWIQRNLVLNAPCGSPDDVDGFLCLTRESKTSSVDRTRISNTKEFYLKWGYSECVPCPAGGPPNWDYSYWAEQITLGSFSRPRYYGVQSPYKMLKTYFGSILQNQADDGCVDYEYGGLNCFTPNGGKGACISSVDLCDGKNDCGNDWDENPSICVGKCDYWIQHLDSEKHWPCHRCKPENLTARECHETCTANCKWYQWEENGNCNHFSSDKISATFQTKNHARAIRGPGKCPVITDEQIVCRQILTPPYRNGAFRIQTYSGRFLQVTLRGINHDLNLIALDRKNLMDSVPRGIVIHPNATEWIIQFHGKRQLADSFSTIRNGIILENPATGEIKAPKYITVRYPDNPGSRDYIGPDGGHVFMREKLNDNFHDPENNLDQRIYIRPVYEFPRDLEPKNMMDIAMYIKYTDPTSKTEKILRFFSEPGDKEYDHHRPGDELPDNLKLFAAGPNHSQDGLNLNQREGRFRLLECDYILPAKKGIPSLPNKYKKHKYFYANCQGSKFSNPALHDYFGLSYNRMWQTTKLPTLIYSICEALKDSHTIWDYAGRMRLSTDDFRRMYYNLQHFDNITSVPAKETLKIVKDYFLENIPEYYSKLESD